METKLGHSQNRQTVFQLSIGGLICQATVMVKQMYRGKSLSYPLDINLEITCRHTHFNKEQCSVFLNMLKMADD